MTGRQEVEVALSRWLRAHHGVIGLVEAGAVGATYGIVRGKTARGEWDSPYPGVYRSASAPHTPLQDLRVACLASGGVVSHASAAWLWGLLCQVPSPVEVSVARQTRTTRRNIDFTVHQSRDLDLSAVATRDGLTVTRPVRTLVDLAGTGTAAQLTEAVDNALAKCLVSVAGLEAEIRRLSKQGRIGVGRLRQYLVDQGFVGAPPPTVLEAHARRLVQRIGIPLPVPEVMAPEAGRYRLDLAWRDILFAVEVDGYAWHSKPQQKRRDELRRHRLREQGWTVLVFDWRQMTAEAAWVGNEIRTTYERLATRASCPPPASAGTRRPSQ